MTRPSPCSSRETFGRAERGGVGGRHEVSAADRIDGNEATPAGWNPSVRYRPDVPKPAQCEGWTYYSGIILPADLDASEQRWAPTKQTVAGSIGGQSRLGSNCNPSTGMVRPIHFGRFHEGVLTSPGCFISGSTVLIGAGAVIVCATQIAAMAAALMAAPHISIILRISHPPKVGRAILVPQSNYGQLHPGAPYRRLSTAPRYLCACRESRCERTTRTDRRIRISMRQHSISRR